MTKEIEQQVDRSGFAVIANLVPLEKVAVLQAGTYDNIAPVAAARNQVHLLMGENH